jgi:ectoine hydroxylase-related dioxygenase (phytanoyl-CoA dioxygenase family)
VAWHQDLTISVRQQRECAGFSGWSRKAGVLHVQPPAYVLQEMLTLRLHLDDTDAFNGALKVIPGSHKFGRMSSQEIELAKLRTPGVICEVPAGGALLMRPLLVHASSTSTNLGHRRVIHLDYSAADLPGGLEWYGS